MTSLNSHPLVETPSNSSPGISLQFFAANLNDGFMRNYECVKFTLEESDFKGPFEEFFFLSLKRWYNGSCGTWGCQECNRYQECNRFQDLIEKIPEKWKNIENCYYKKSVGKELVIENDFLNKEYASMRYDIGGEEFEKIQKGIEKMLK